VLEYYGFTDGKKFPQQQNEICRTRKLNILGQFSIKQFWRFIRLLKILKTVLIDDYFKAVI